MNPTTNNAIVPSMPRGFVKIEPDDNRWKNKFHVNSASSDRVYRISYDSASGAGWWMCACMGCIRHGTCKHLTAIGLRPTRQDIMQKRLSDQSAPGPQQSRPASNRPQRRLGRGK